MRKMARQFLFALTACIAMPAGGAQAPGTPGEPGAVPSASDGAYVPPPLVEPPLPVLPERPRLDVSAYPDCREDYQKRADPFDKAADTNRCTTLIDGFYNQILLPFRQSMIAYQDQLSALYSDKVGGNRLYSAATQNRFYQDIMAEHAASGPDGRYLADWRAADARYQADRDYLADRYCYFTGCGGYKAAVSLPAAAEKHGDAKPDSQAKCKRARKRGGGLGGFLGGVAGSAAGLKGVGSALAGVFGAVLVSEIACQLDEKEQEKAAEATIAVTKEERVGAAATWYSPTREGVSGSSTVTALAAEPNGGKCLTITDVAIVEGQETRVSKQMCREKGEDHYVLRA